MTSKANPSPADGPTEAPASGAFTAYATPAIPAGVDGATFLPDPVTDELVRVMMELGAALWVERRRTRTLERVLVRSGALAPDAMEQWVDEPEDAASDSEELKIWMKRTFGALAQVGPAAPGTGETQ